jgi:hypothetical protein
MIPWLIVNKGLSLMLRSRLRKSLSKRMRVLYWWLEEHVIHPKKLEGKNRDIATSSNLLVQWEVRCVESWLTREAVRVWCVKCLKIIWGWRWRSILVPIGWHDSRKGNKVTVSKCCLVPFSIRSKYRDKAWDDVVAIDAFHLLLGRPQQY